MHAVAKDGFDAVDSAILDNLRAMSFQGAQELDHISEAMLLQGRTMAHEVRRHKAKRSSRPVACTGGPPWAEGHLDVFFW